jgi:hypothetical protein
MNWHRLMYGLASHPTRMGRAIIARGGWEAGQEKVSLGVFVEATQPEFRKCRAT